MFRSTRFALAIATLTLFATAVAAKDTFLKSDDGKEKDEPQTFLSNYDKLNEGKEADWTYYAGKLSGIGSVSIKDFTVTVSGKKKDERVAKEAADSGPEYLENWISDSKLGWKIVKSGGDLKIEGNVFNSWEPSGAASYWGGALANPGVGIEIKGTDKSGKVVFEIRHKGRGSTLDDAMENALETVVEDLQKNK